MSLNYQSLLLFSLTVISFAIAKIAYHRGKNNILLQPLLVGVILVVFCLYFLNIPYSQYIDSNRIFQWLLGPAVVSLAIPLYKNSHHIRQWLGGVLLTIVISASLGVLITWMISQLFELQLNTQIALITKSATTPIALSINEVLSGNKALAATVVMFTGLFGAMIGPVLLTRLGFHDHRIMGLALGLTSHAIGTQKALEISPLCGAFAAFAMTLTGGFLALVLPFLV
ncbi:MAG: LrgB family protein [Oleispira sp.]|nr:LrgB family protein [Oleispira sp.]MBL4882706.1 LrgB family protein [Oleispira sp.]